MFRLYFTFIQLYNYGKKSELCKNLHNVCFIELLCMFIPTCVEFQRIDSVSQYL